MPVERSPSPLSHTVVSMANSSEDRNSQRSDSIATVEIFRSDCDQGFATRTPSEDTESENVSRHRMTTPHEESDCKKFVTDEVPEIPLERKSSGISKGVILNAMNFGSYDLKCSSDDLKEKPTSKEQEMSENGDVSKPPEENVENSKAAEAEKGAEEKQKMSLPRKIAFGFSFLPSVMFVLAFAVILPCEEYKTGGSCVRRRWSLLLGQTEITSELSLPEKLLLGYEFANSTYPLQGLMNLDDETGKDVWRQSLKFFPKYIKCDVVDANQDDVKDCLAILDNGNVLAFNLSDGSEFWTYSSHRLKEDATVLLAGCPSYKNLKPIAVASYNAGSNNLSIDIISERDGSVLSSKRIEMDVDCSLFTFAMEPWGHSNTVDLLYFCRNLQGSGFIRRVKQSLWCLPGNTEGTIEPEKLWSSDKNETVTYLPTHTGLLIWSGTQITFLDLEGTVKWNDSTHYVPQVRMPKSGRFYIGGEQIALIGQNSSSNIAVSIIVSDSGEEILSVSIPEKRLNQAIVLRGNETDDLLLSVLKVKVTETEELADKEVIIHSNISSPSDFGTDAPYKVNGNKNVVEELLLLQFEGKNSTHVVYKNEVSPHCDNGSCESEYPAIRTLSAFSENKGGSMNLKIITLRTPEDINKRKRSGSRIYSELTALDITHPDGSNGAESSCTL